MNYTPKDENSNGIPDTAEQRVDNVPEESREYVDSLTDGKESFWKDKPLGRTLTLRNKTGKIGATVLGGAASTLIPGPVGDYINKGFDALITTQTMTGMELFDLSFLQMGIFAGVALLMWALPSIVPSIKEKAAWKMVEARIDDVTDQVVKAVDEDSEKGKKITRSELKAIIASALKKEE